MFIVPPVQFATMPGQGDCTTHMSDLVKKGKERQQNKSTGPQILDILRKIFWTGLVGKTQTAPQQKINSDMTSWLCASGTTVYTLCLGLLVPIWMGACAMFAEDASSSKSKCAKAQGNRND